MATPPIPRSLPGSVTGNPQRQGLAGHPPIAPTDPGAAAMSAQVRSPEVGAPSQSINDSWGPMPAMTAGLTFREVGSSGLRQFSGWVREEYLQQLVGRQGAQKYREMMDNSPVVGAILYAIQATMRKVEWRMLPAADTPAAQEAADFADSCRQDMSHTWEDLVGENLSMLPFGYSAHEIVYKRRLGRTPGADPAKPGEDLPRSDYDDGKIGWRRLPMRSQDTVLKWFFDGNGQVKGVTQQPWVGPLVDIPIEKMLLFRPLYYKGNPEGRSILRNAYVPYYYIKRLQEHEAILFERLGGVPCIKIPGHILESAAAGDAQAVATVNAYKSIVVNLRTDEQMGVLLPSDMQPGPNGPSTQPAFSFELVTPQIRASGLDFDKSITRYSNDIMTSVLADFLSLGHQARGTQSLAVSKVDMFFQAIEGTLNATASVYNRFAIPRLFELNGMNEDLRPQLEPDLAQRIDLDVLSNYILRLSQAGMPMFPDDELQGYIRDAAGLPDIQDDRALQAAGLLNEQLDRTDEKDQIVVDNMKNPPEPAAPMSPLKKMILASMARRAIRAAGPRYGVHTHKRGTRKFPAARMSTGATAA